MSNDHNKRKSENSLKWGAFTYFPDVDLEKVDTEKKIDKIEMETIDKNPVEEKGANAEIRQ